MDLKTFGQAMRELAEEKGVAEEKVRETIELAIAAAYKKDYGKKGQIIRARLEPSTGEFQFSQIKLVVDERMIKSEEEIAHEEALGAETAAVEAASPLRPEIEELEEISPAVGAGAEGETAAVRKVRFNPERHIMFEEAREIKPDVQPGEELEFALEPKREFGRIASQTAKQVIIQRIREAERDATYAEFKGREGEIVSGIVQRIEGRNIFLDLGRGVGVLPPEEQIQRERVAIGGRLKAILILVEKEMRGPGLVLSRSHPAFVKKLFALEVPEIQAGTVEIKQIAREAGSRSKVAVASHDPAVDPVGSMVGQRGVRVSTVINELGGEKIDIIEWSEDPARFVANALSPAKILDVTLDPERREATALAPDEQLSLAIGRGGQNVRLAAKLTGWKIDVRSAARPAAEEAAAAQAPAEAESEAEQSADVEAGAETAVPPAQAEEAKPETASDLGMAPGTEDAEAEAAGIKDEASDEPPVASTGDQGKSQ